MYTGNFHNVWAWFTQAYAEGSFKCYLRKLWIVKPATLGANHALEECSKSCKCWKRKAYGESGELTTLVSSSAELMHGKMSLKPCISPCRAAPISFTNRITCNALSCPSILSACIGSFRSQAQSL